MFSLSLQGPQTDVLQQRREGPPRGDYPEGDLLRCGRIVILVILFAYLGVNSSPVSAHEAGAIRRRHHRVLLERGWFTGQYGWTGTAFRQVLQRLR